MYWIISEELSLQLSRYSWSILKHMTAILTFIALSKISVTVFLHRNRATFWTLFIHRTKIERINRSIMRKTEKNNHRVLTIKPKSWMKDTWKNMSIGSWSGGDWRSCIWSKTSQKEKNMRMRINLTKRYSWSIQSTNFWNVCPTSRGVIKRKHIEPRYR